MKFLMRLGFHAVVIWLSAVWAASGLGAQADIPDRPTAGHVHVPVEPEPPVAGQPLDDRAIFRFLEVGGKKMIESGSTLTNWSALLGARTTAYKLPRSHSRPLPLPELARRMERASAILATFFDCGRCSQVHMAGATGFFISRSGLLATCHHVMGGYVSNGLGIVALTRDGRLCPVRSVAASDPTNDIIVLQIEGERFDYLPLASEDAAVGSTVAVMSHPQGHYYLFSTGTVSRFSSMKKPGDAASRWMGITADFAKGSSGAAVCNESGAVVGMVNNTESIYYNATPQRQDNLQMVIKNCTTTGDLRKLFTVR